MLAAVRPLLRSAWRFLRREDAITLVMAMLVLGSMTFTGATLIYYVDSTGRSAAYSNNVTSDNFPIIQTVPAGMPGSPLIYAQPNSPQLYGG